jgi:hypothetical protein
MSYYTFLSLWGNLFFVSYNIHVAQYLTQLPPKKILEEKLRKAISIAREKYERLQEKSRK